jgi:hypothetical protein
VKKPHPLPQTDQSTPELLESLATAAIRFTDVSTCIREGAKGTKAIECTDEATTVIGIDSVETLGKAVAVATICSETPGSAGGAT